jgi:hypothetical protein
MDYYNWVVVTVHLIYIRLLIINQFYDDSILLQAYSAFGLRPSCSVEEIQNGNLETVLVSIFWYCCVFRTLDVGKGS